MCETKSKQFPHCDCEIYKKKDSKKFSWNQLFSKKHYFHEIFVKKVRYLHLRQIFRECNIRRDCEKSIVYSHSQWLFYKIVSEITNKLVKQSLRVTVHMYVYFV